MLGEKLFGRDIKIENCSLRLKRSIKKPNFWKFFFHFLQKFDRTITVLGEKLFGRDIKSENCSLRLIRSNKNSNFWKISFFFKFFRTSNKQLPCSAENFSAALSKLKNAVFVSKDQSKNQTSESSLFFQILQNFERTITVLGRKLFGSVIKIEKCSLRLERSIERSNFWKFAFFQILQNFERAITVLGGKLFGRDIKIKNCSLRLTRSIKKSNFWKFSFLSNSSGF